ncbi:hypothetical protein, partial [Escherichia coli]|uniref:hypothetical protein n=1 Tax=Escherichia coli TaxID=562 RepID=UPI001F3C54EE
VVRVDDIGKYISRELGHFVAVKSKLLNDSLTSFVNKNPVTTPEPCDSVLNASRPLGARMDIKT